MITEYLPATGATQQELVLLHGWGSSLEIWRPALARLRDWGNITLLDIPGCSPAATWDHQPGLDEVLAAILRYCPPRAVFVGWSLGGQLAVEIAARFPYRACAVVTICSNPRFVATDDWPGMEPALFTRFRELVEDDPGGALDRFDSLQVSGAKRPRPLLRRLPTDQRKASSAQLLSGLQWLRDLDQRPTLAGITQPQLHLLGGRDNLVPPPVYGRLQQLLAPLTAAQVTLLGEASHVAPLDSTAELTREIKAFVECSQLLCEQRVAVNTRAKREVAESFGRAASLYDSVAGLQQDVGRQLLQRVRGLARMPATVLDLGCGTGYFQQDLGRLYPDAEYIGLDLAEGMVEYARGRSAGKGLWAVGDAEALPLATDSVDLVFSSLALQWCDRPLHLFAELARVLRPGGRCVFTSLGPDTLRELRSSWAAVDNYQHVNSFLTSAELAAAADAVPGIVLRLDNENFQMEYERVRDLLSELKTLGAHNMNRDRPAGLTSRATLQGMLQAYESWRTGGLLPATYDVIFGVVEVV